jgi:hypothetical protein
MVNIQVIPHCGFVQRFVLVRLEGLYLVLQKLHHRIQYRKE